jgi:hypothetical protein|tara:strand:+ start:200 stop:484 length:285 start_codon:yes stop_codon:yes gene_type:complete
MVEYKTIRQFANESGYTEKAVREKIRKGIFPEDEVWLWAPDNRKLISIEGFNLWAIQGRELLKGVAVASSSPLPIKNEHSEKELKLGVSPLVLT